MTSARDLMHTSCTVISPKISSEDLAGDGAGIIGIDCWEDGDASGLSGEGEVILWAAAALLCETRLHSDAWDKR